MRAVAGCASSFLFLKKRHPSLARDLARIRYAHCRHYIVAGAREIFEMEVFQGDVGPAARRHERDARAHIDSAYHYRSQPADRT